MPHPAYEGFKVYDEKTDDTLFRIYEDKLEEETTVVLRESSRDINIKKITEVTIKTDKPILEVNPVSIVPTLRPVLQEINTNICEDNNYQDDDDDNNSPVLSVEKSIDFMDSMKNDMKAKREASKIIINNFYDIEEYRADIFNYLKIAEVIIIVIIHVVFFFWREK